MFQYWLDQYLAEGKRQGPEAQLDKIRKVQGMRDGLINKLDTSIQIKLIWPQAFEQGAVKSSVIGRPGDLRFRVVRKDGSKKVWLFREIPRKLRDQLAKRHNLDRYMLTGKRK